MCTTLRSGLNRNLHELPQCVLKRHAFPTNALRFLVLRPGLDGSSRCPSFSVDGRDDGRLTGGSWARFGTAQDGPRALRRAANPPLLCHRRAGPLPRKTRHGFANALRKLPSRATADVIPAADLVSGDAVVVRCELTEHEQPGPKRHVASVHDRLGCDGKRLAARRALPHPPLGLFAGAGLARNAVLRSKEVVTALGTTVGARDFVAPARLFQVLVGTCLGSDLGTERDDWKDLHGWHCRRGLYQSSCWRPKSHRCHLVVGSPMDQLPMILQEISGKVGLNSEPRPTAIPNGTDRPASTFPLVGDGERIRRTEAPERCRQCHDRAIGAQHLDRVGVGRDRCRGHSEIGKGDARKIG